MRIPVFVFGPFAAPFRKELFVRPWTSIKRILRKCRVKLTENQWISVDGKFSLTREQLRKPVRDFKTYDEMYLMVVEGRRI